MKNKSSVEWSDIVQRSKCHFWHPHVPVPSTLAVILQVPPSFLLDQNPVLQISKQVFPHLHVTHIIMTAWKNFLI